MDLNNQFLNIYLDGELQTDIGRPKGPSFKGLSGEFCAALCLYGTKVEVTMVTGIATPSVPGNQGWSPKESLTDNCASTDIKRKKNQQTLKEFLCLEQCVQKRCSFR